MDNHQQPKFDTEKDKKTNRQKIYAVAVFIGIALLFVIAFFASLWKTPTLLKKNIINAAEDSYHTLRESIKRFPDEYGITPSVFHALNAFPPKIGAIILIAIIGVYWRSTMLHQ